MFTPLTHRHALSLSWLGTHRHDLSLSWLGTRISIKQLDIRVQSYWLTTQPDYISSKPNSIMFS
jgi:hypothetical protein